MLSKATKPQKPEEMLLRLIRVAEILVKGQNTTSEESSVKPMTNQTAATAIDVQKHKHEILM